MPEFYSPKTIVQYAEYPDTDISWSNNQVDTSIKDDPSYNLANPAPGAGQRNVIQSTKNLAHIPNPTRGPKLDKTYFLKCTKFGMTGDTIPTSVTGIEVRLDAQRWGRIVDETVCLVYNGEIISENKTNISAIREGHLTNNNVQTYGGFADMWGAEITREMLASDSFGVLLRFSSNPLYPHRDTIEVYRITIKLYPYNSFQFETSDEFFISELTGDLFVPE